ncbi:MAG: iron chelate uptake ABC transporter family permease subunit [Streptosporangiales bacterium]|nr:iron chelate uptake ABC transporter family permease subunit [Streptosporangiales bacterium]
MTESTDRTRRPVVDRWARGVVLRARLQRRARVTAVTLGLAGVCFAVCCVSLSVGDVHIPVLDVVRTLVGAGDGGTDFIVNRLRLPRVLVAVLAGAAFGLSGAMFQTLVRNPLASPDIVGITAGASAAAVIAILSFGLSGYAVSLAAFVGALGVAIAIYLLAWRGGVTGYRMVLIGIALAAVMTSVVSFWLTRAEVYDAQDALIWLTGSLNAKTWTTVRILGLSASVLAPLAFLASRRLDVLQLGDETARAIGVAVERSRLGVLVVAVAVTAVATAAVGPVAFVAFTAGPIARRLVGHGAIALVPAAFVGALTMTAADFLAQHAFASVTFPVGVVTAIVGAPYLLWLLAVTNRVGRAG